jgi:hypothetical protein
MVNRYQELLEAVKEGKVAEVDLDDETKRALRRKAFEITNTPKEAQQKYVELVQTKIADESFLREGEEDEELEEAAEHRVATFERQQGSPYAPSERRKMVAEIKGKLRQEGYASTPRALRLDGEGYRRALDSLQAEFPYFIRDVRHEPLRDFETNRNLDVVSRQPGRGPGDRGFVSRGDNLAGVSSGQDRAVRSRNMVAGRTVERTAARQAEEAREKGTEDKPAAAPAAAVKEPVPDFTPREVNDKVPALTEVLKTPAGEVMRDEALDAMNDLLGGGEDARGLLRGALPDYTSWTESKITSSTRPEHVLAFLEREDIVGGNPLNWLLTKAKPETRQAVHDVLLKVPQMTRDFDDEDYAERINQAAQTVVDLLEFADPFGPPPTTEALFKVPSEHDKPFAFSQIVALRTDPANYDAWAARASVADDDMKEFLEDGVTLSKINAAINLRAQLRQKVEAGGHDVEDRKAELAVVESQIPKLHLVRSFVEARDKAYEWERRAGAVPFDKADRSASLSRSQLRPGRRVVRKRQRSLREAEEFGKALRSLGRSLPRSR